ADVALRIFGGDDRDIELLPQLHIRIDVLFVERVLVPEKAEPLDGAADTHCVGVTIAPGGIEHQGELVADVFAAMSHSAASQAPIARRPRLRWRARIAACRSSRASGSLPTSTGFKNRISAPASVSAGLVAEPRKA